MEKELEQLGDGGEPEVLSLKMVRERSVGERRVGTLKVFQILVPEKLARLHRQVQRRFRCQCNKSSSSQRALSRNGGNRRDHGHKATDPCVQWSSTSRKQSARAQQVVQALVSPPSQTGTSPMHPLFDDQQQVPRALWGQMFPPMQPPGLCLSEDPGESSVL